MGYGDKVMKTLSDDYIMTRLSVKVLGKSRVQRAGNVLFRAFSVPA